MSGDIPNYVTLGAEIAVGIGIAWYIHKLQSRTERNREAVINDIKKYTEDVKEHEIIRRKYYIKRMKEILNLIREQDIILKDFITDIKKDPKNRHPITRKNLEDIEEDVRTRS